MSNRTTNPAFRKIQVLEAGSLPKNTRCRFWVSNELHLGVVCDTRWNNSNQRLECYVRSEYGDVKDWVSCDDVEIKRNPKSGEYWQMKSGTVVYIIGVAPMLWLPLISVDSTGNFHRHLEDGTSHKFLHKESIEDLVKPLPDFKGFNIPPDAYQAPLMKAEEAVA